jgi:hypothetical protein
MQKSKVEALNSILRKSNLKTNNAKKVRNAIMYLLLAKKNVKFLKSILPLDEKRTNCAEDALWDISDAICNVALLSCKEKVDITLIQQEEEIKYLVTEEEEDIMEEITQLNL